MISSAPTVPAGQPAAPGPDAQSSLGTSASADLPATTTPSNDPTSAEMPELVIAAPKGWAGLDLDELIRYRELLYFMVWRDLKVRYKQTILGVAWAVLQPTFQMVVFTVIFGHLAKLDSDGYPYALFVMVGQMPWLYFSTGVGTASLSLVNQQNLLTKVYFPRLFVPASAIGTCLVDFAISSSVLAAVMLWYRAVPSWQVVFVPFLLFAVTLATLGLGFLMAALTVTYRDLRFIVPFMIQVLMYVSPVIYPVSIIPARYQWLAALNPMMGLIDGFRSAVLGKPWNLTTLGVSVAASVVLFVIGTMKFRSTERLFADIA